MRKVWLIADALISPLGLTGPENFNQIISGKTGVQVRRENQFGDSEVCVSHCGTLQIPADSTRFETLCKMALSELTGQIALTAHRTLFMLSTTKGNIEVLEQGRSDHPRLPLHKTAQMLARSTGIEDQMVVSNACTSGVVAMIVAKRQIESGHYDHAVILGADTISRFVISGFQSLNALSAKPCRPFDAARSGVNLGEAAAVIVMTAQPEKFNSNYRIALRGGAISNDANHISGPSKTGEELALAIRGALGQADAKSNDLDFISAHGTATVYNDEMEAKAFYLVGLEKTPMHSLKGNFGHTLGAAGVVETVMCIHSLVNQELIPSIGFETLGVSRSLNVIQKRESRSLRTVLKTSSGFGGCNAAIVLQLEN